MLRKKQWENFKKKQVMLLENRNIGCEKDKWKGNTENEKITQATLKDTIAENFLELITNKKSQILMSILRYYIRTIQNLNEIEKSQQ